MPSQRLLLPLFGDPLEEALVRLAGDLARPVRGTVYALYVVEVPRQFALEADMPEATAAGERVLAQAERALEAMKCHVEAAILQARSAGVAIVKEAVEREADHILVGVPYQQQFRSFAFSRTILYLLQEAPCTVLVARVPVGIQHPRPLAAQGKARSVGVP
ncbi:MAG: universal stress protein [Dehalococcoidia bacterium]|nr:universal stress protein [Dehalococcoidia bacterium]